MIYYIVYNFECSLLLPINYTDISLKSQSSFFKLPDNFIYNGFISNET